MDPTASFDQDTLSRYRAAKAAGVPEDENLREAIKYQASKGEAQTQEGGGGFLNLLSNIFIPQTKKTFQKAVGPEQVGGGDIARTLLELGSFLIPFGRGATLASKALIPGAGVGALRGLSEEEATPGSVLASTGIGAGLGGVLSKLLGAGAGASAKVGAAVPEEGILTKFGQGGLRQSTVAPRSTIATFPKQQELIDVVRRAPIMSKGFTRGGSALKKFSLVDKQINSYVNQVDDILRNVKTTVPASRLSQEATAIANQLQGAEKSAFIKVYNRLVKQAFGGKELTGKIDLTGLNLNALNRILNKQSGPLYNKLAREGTLTNDQHAILQLKELVDDLLISITPAESKAAIGALNKDISTLIKGRPEFKRLAEEGLTLFGTRIPLVSPAIPRVFQAFADITGRGALKSGEVLERFAGRPGIQDMLMRLGIGATTAAGEPGRVQAQEPLTENILSGFETGEKPKTEADLIRTVLGAMMFQSADSISELKTAYDFLYPEGGGESELVKRTKLQSQQAQSKIKVLEDEFARVQAQGLTARGPLLGRLGGVAGSLAALTQTSTEAAAYRRGVEAFLSQLSRATGERGVLTDRDIRRIKKLIPNFYDRPEVAAEQFRLLREAVSSAFQQGKTTEAGT